MKLVVDIAPTILIVHTAQFHLHCLSDIYITRLNILCPPPQLCEILKYVKAPSETTSPNMCSFVNHFNSVSFWASSLVLRRETKVCLKEVKQVKLFFLSSATAVQIITRETC